MSATTESGVTALDRLGLLLEQMNGVMAVATSADLEELRATDLRSFLYTVEDFVIRANAALHDHLDERTAQHQAQRQSEANRGSVQ